MTNWIEMCWYEPLHWFKRLSAQCSYCVQPSQPLIPPSLHRVELCILRRVLYSSDACADSATGWHSIMSLHSQLAKGWLLMFTELKQCRNWNHSFPYETEPIRTEHCGHLMDSNFITRIH